MKSMPEYPLTLGEIVRCHSKQVALADSDVSLTEIRERTDYLPAAFADFDGIGVMGRITGWVSGLFDFEVLRVLDGEGIFWRHVEAESTEDLEKAYLDFIVEIIRRSTGPMS